MITTCSSITGGFKIYRIGRLKITYRSRAMCLYGFAGWAHEHKNGDLVLKDEASWRTISGFFINSRRLNRHWWVQWVSKGNGNV